MTDPIGKEHAEQTQTKWDRALREPDPHGGLVANVCDLIEDYAAGKIEWDAAVQKAIAKRCKGLKVKPLDVWNAMVALSIALGRTTD